MFIFTIKPLLYRFPSLIYFEINSSSNRDFIFSNKIAIHYISRDAIMISLLKVWTLKFHINNNLMKAYFVGIFSLWSAFLPIIFNINMLQRWAPREQDFFYSNAASDGWAMDNFGICWMIWSAPVHVYDWLWPHEPFMRIKSVEPPNQSSKSRYFLVTTSVVISYIFSVPEKDSSGCN